MRGREGRREEGRGREKEGWSEEGALYGSIPTSDFKL